ncbi:PAS domain-containing protein [Methanoplanus endosymbiosus]|uniref:PAS domain-containing protein n=1 Tax=Methanoplanus endosymbiosus TaxID=33865 RepID=A0A9E7PMS3_9EURY|nr:PAS domain-containing protein [Methanoplanus endosymbiosus]UUX93109.1 PAS domain-containing protein [Methanoplanus endosymbiosus]
MKLLTNNKLFIDTILIFSVLITVIITWYCLQNQILNVFPHIYYIPVILSAYIYRKYGMILISGLCIYYITAVGFFYFTDFTVMMSAVIRVLAYILIGYIIIILAERIEDERKIFHKTFEYSKCGLALISPDLKILVMNPEMENISGYTNYTEKKLEIKDLFSDKNYNEIDSCVEGKKEFCYREVILKSKSGEDKTVIVNFTDLTEKNLILLSLTDITKRVEAEYKIKSSEMKFRTLWENISAGMIIIDEKTHEIISANPEINRLSGYDKEEIEGQICHNFICPNKAGKCPISDLKQDVNHTETILITKNKDRIPVLKSAAIAEIDDKKVIIENIIDIRKQKEAELDLLSYVRETALRIKNPVDIVKQYLIDLICELKEEQEIDREDLIIQLSVQIYNLRVIKDNLSDMDRAIAENRKEIPDAFREYLTK